MTHLQPLYCLLMMEDTRTQTKADAAGGQSVVEFTDMTVLALSCTQIWFGTRKRHAIKTMLVCDPPVLAVHLEIHVICCDLCSRL